MCKNEGYEIELLHFKYGCRAEEHEEKAIMDIGLALGAKVHTAPLNIYDPKDSRLFDKDCTIAGGVLYPPDFWE